MAQVADYPLTVAQRYIAELEAHGIHLRSVVLFGSWAKGNADEWSGIDVALVSDDFEGSPFDDKSRIRRITLSVDKRLEPHPYRTEDFSEEDPLVREILETGVKVK
jgi:predicted nucleotidyltransferase